jgi:two-component system sensor histidine kinase PilS (NtrC family)
MSDAPPVYSGLFGRDALTPEPFWVSLRYFNLYRIAIAAMFLGIVLVYGDALNLGSHRLDVFRAVSGAYLLLGTGFAWALAQWRERFNLQLSLHVFVDIVAITVLMYASGGIRSGLGMMLLISLICAALVAPRRLTWLYAAVAAIALLLEQSLWVLAFDAPTASYFQPALLAVGCFAGAGVTGWLTQRAAASQMLAQERGRELERQMRVSQLVIEDMQDGVLVLDREGRVTQHNPRAQRLLEADSLVGEELAQRLPGFGDAWRAWREGRPGAPAYDLDNAGRGLRVRFVETGEGSEFCVLFLEDITRSRDQAQQLTLAALGRLTANMAHEIRNPLSAISHASELLDEDRGPMDRSRLTRIVRDNTRRLERLVSEVLQLSRRDRGAPDRIDLSAWLRVFVGEFCAGESVPFERIAVEGAPNAWIEFDREHLRQVLWNLLRNAVRYAPPVPRSVRLELRNIAHQVQLSVIDEGPGVPATDQAQLFEPFFTTDSKGTGLGLYLARELCATNRAWLEYLDDMRGAHFRIRFREVTR